MARPSNATRRCPECQSDSVARRAGEQSCDRCGLVLESTRVRATRPRSQFRSSRASGPPTRPSQGMSTAIGPTSKDRRGNPLPQSKQRRLRRQRRCQRRAVSDTLEDSMQIGISEIDRLGGHLSIGEEARTIAKTMFRRAVDERLLYGRAAESVAAATVYLGSRRGGVHRGLSEVASLSQVSRRQVARDSRYLQRELDLSIEPPTVTAYLPRIRTALDLDERAGRLARQLLGQAIEANLHSGRDPNGLAASALYTVSVVDEAVPGRSQRAVAAAADVCPETIRRRHRELRDVAPAAFGDDDSAVGLTTDQTRTAGRESRAHPIPDDAGG